jgi:hypothetical protein
MQSRHTSGDAIMYELMRGNMSATFNITDTQYATLIDGNQCTQQASFESTTFSGTYLG